MQAASQIFPFFEIPNWAVRNIADVTTAVANGGLSKKITVDVVRQTGIGNRP